MDESGTTKREGQLLAGKYRLVRMLGAGGQGEVYRAVNEMTGRDVAIKRLRAGWGGDPIVAARVLREARAATMVRHPNVVDVLDVGSDEDGAPFIVQELLEGVSLDSHLDDRGGALPVADALAIFAPVVDALCAAHDRGVIHRDLKPANVFLVYSGGAFVPKVLDFGLSKMTTPHGRQDVTTTGEWFGSPAYMAPEQIRTLRTVDARSDVWALGVMLYEMLAGTRPFESQTVGDLFVVICTEEAKSLADVAPLVPKALRRIQERCMRRDPGERYPSARELAEDIAVFRRGEEMGQTMSAPVASPTPRDPPASAGAPPSDVAPHVTDVSGVGDPPASVSTLGGRVSVGQGLRKRGSGTLPLLVAGTLGVVVVGLGATRAMRSTGHAELANETAPRVAGTPSGMVVAPSPPPPVVDPVPTPAVVRVAATPTLVAPSPPPTTSVARTRLPAPPRSAPYARGHATQGSEPAVSPPRNLSPQTPAPSAHPIHGATQYE